jgi:hypothetical protein
LRGKREGRAMVYAGKLERGFTEQGKIRILTLHDRLKTKTAPTTPSPSSQGAVDEAEHAGGRGTSRPDRRGRAAAP